MKPLDGLTILDLTRVLSGPFATQQLYDLGAEIIKIEHPTRGDDTRKFGPPFVEGESTYFMSVNRGKKSVAIDLKSAEGRELALRLAEQADVAIENFRPGTADRLGLGVQPLRTRNPSIITCAISGYGSGGVPEYEGLPGYDAMTQAATGIMALTGAPDGPPVKVGIAISDMVAGLYAAQGILAALFARQKSGEGTHIEISMQDGMCSLLTYQAGSYLATGRDPARMGNAHPSICPYETVQTQDGLYALAVGNDAQFERLAEMVGRPELAKDARFVTNAARVENRSALMAILSPIFQKHSRAEWKVRLAEAGIPGGEVLTVSQALEHPQLLGRGSILEHQHPKSGRVRTVASPVRFDGARPVAGPPPPLLGEHTATVLSEKLKLEPARMQALFEAGVIGRPAS